MDSHGKMKCLTPRRYWEQAEIHHKILINVKGTYIKK